MDKYVADVVKDYMRANGYDALYSDSCCACFIDDLAPCDNNCMACDFGVKVDCEHCEKLNECEDSSVELGYDACEIGVCVGWCEKAVLVKH